MVRKRTAEASRNRNGRRRELSAGLSLLFVVFGLGACRDDAPERAERCIWQIGTISSDAAEPGFDGVPVLQGIRFGIAHANRDRKLPCRLELVERPADTPQKTREAAAELAENDRVVAVVGPYSSAAVERASPSFAEGDLPVLAPTATRADLEVLDRAHFFRLIATDVVEGDSAARFVTEVAGAQRVVSINEPSGYARTLSGALTDRLASIVVDAAELEEDPDFQDVVTKIAKAEPDAIFFSGTGAALAELVTEAEAGDLDLLFAAPSTAKDPGLLGVDAARGALIFCSCADPASSSDSEVRAWATDFQKDIGEAPGPFALEAFEAVQIVATAVADSGFTRDSPIAEIREGIATWAHGSAYLGLTKAYAFDSRGELMDAPVFVYQVSRTGWREVGRVADLVG